MRQTASTLSSSPGFPYANTASLTVRSTALYRVVQSVQNSACAIHNTTLSSLVTHQDDQLSCRDGNVYLTPKTFRAHTRMVVAVGFTAEFGAIPDWTSSKYCRIVEQNRDMSKSDPCRCINAPVPWQLFRVEALAREYGSQQATPTYRGRPTPPSRADAAASRSAVFAGNLCVPIRQSPSKWVSTSLFCRLASAGSPSTLFYKGLLYTPPHLYRSRPYARHCLSCVWCTGPL